MPGESYLALLDGLYTHRERLRVITCRHEAAAANAADAYGKLTGRPGVCMVTRGPGATHAVHGRAHRDAGLDAARAAGRSGAARASRARGIPGDRLRADVRARRQVGVRDRRRRADSRARRARLRDGGRGTSRPGRAGAARGRALGDDRRCGREARAARVPRRPESGALARMRELLAAAERPLAIVGGGGWTAEGAADLAAFLDGGGIPVGGVVPLPGRDRQPPAGLLRRSRPGRQPLAGAASARGRRRARGRHAALGDRDRRLHLPHAAAAESDARARAPGRLRSSGSVYRPALGIVSGLPEFAAAARALEPLDGGRYADWRAGARSRLRGRAPLRPGSRPRRRHGRRPGAPARAPARRDRRQRRGQLHGLGAPLLAVLALPLAARAALGGHGLRRPGGAWPASSSTPSGRSSRSRATAAS